MTKDKKYTMIVHYDQIGWLITSFFLIFLGTMLPEFIDWTKEPNSVDKYIMGFVIFLTMSFGFIVARLFLKSQKKKNDYLLDKYSKKNISNKSIIIYVIFMIFIESILAFISYKINLINEAMLIIIILIIITLFICPVRKKFYKLQII